MHKKSRGYAAAFDPDNMEVRWGRSGHGKYETLRLESPLECRLEGKIYKPGRAVPILPEEYRSESIFKVDWMESSKSGTGAGVKMLLMAADVLREKGIGYIYGQVLNPGSAKSFGRAFPGDKTRVMDIVSKTNELKPAGISYEELLYRFKIHYMISRIAP